MRQLPALGAPSHERVCNAGSGKVGIATGEPLVTLHVEASSAGMASGNYANVDTVASIEKGGNGGMSILNPNANSGYIWFGAPQNVEDACVAEDIWVALLRIVERRTSRPQRSF